MSVRSGGIGPLAWHAAGAHDLEVATTVSGFELEPTGAYIGVSGVRRGSAG